ncbi:MAG: hypothetical protein E7580_08215 [Ruminococcaceae bacterium]|nr:hypothetical protein [Oscillospiraceae bacterium]
MTKEFLDTSLTGFIKAGYLKERYSDKQISVFLFLECVSVGFFHDSADDAPSGAPKGALLTEGEVQVILRSGSLEALDFLCQQEECSLVFSEELLKRCGSKKDRAKLKRSFKPLYNTATKGSKTAPLPLLTHFPSILGTIVIREHWKIRKNFLKKYKKQIKNVLLFGTILLSAFSLMLASFLTRDFRDQFNSDQESILFDNNGEDDSYARIEIDFLVPFATLFSTSQNVDKDRLRTYYLWGNQENESYGVLSFSEIDEESELFPEGQRSVVFPEPVILYGTPAKMPYKISAVLNSAKADSDPLTLPGHTITTPDGEEIYIPGQTIQLPDVPDVDDGTGIEESISEAMDFLAEQGISIDKNTDFGTRYLFASTECEKVVTPLNRVINVLGAAGFISIGLFFIPLLFFAFKTDGSKEMLRKEDLILHIYESLIPVQTSGQCILLHSEAFLKWYKGTNAPFECTATLPLTSAAPSIHLLEDDQAVREYVLETEGKEDFTDKFFQSSIRLSVMGSPAAPVALIDGFISDTPEDRKMNYSDVGYRMEVYFLACGGKNSETRYEMNRGQDLPQKALKYAGYTTPSNVRLIGVCPYCKKSFAFHGYAFYMAQSDVAYSDDGLDCCEIRAQGIDKENWVYTVEGKTFRYYNSFNCPHCGTPYIDYQKFPQNKVFGVSGCVLLGKKPYHDQ